VASVTIGQRSSKSRWEAGMMAGTMNSLRNGAQASTGSVHHAGQERGGRCYAAGLVILFALGRE
jgi:hypothetical protein